MVLLLLVNLHLAYISRASPRSVYVNLVSGVLFAVMQYGCCEFIIMVTVIA